MPRTTRATYWVRLPLLSALVAACVSLPLGSPAAEDAPAKRPYADGPLTVDDYQAPPPDDSGRLLAFTTTDMTYQAGHRYAPGNRKVTAYLTGITIDAVVVRDQSWIKQRSDKRLLDHEQGHFDLTMIGALRASLHFTQRYQTTKLTANGATEGEAKAALQTKIERDMRKFFDELFAGQQEYDRVTAHGTIPAVQDEHRRQQRATLQELTEKLKKARKN